MITAPGVHDNFGLPAEATGPSSRDGASSPPRTQVIFETHSTSTDNEENIASGHTDPPLSAMRREQAQRLGRRYNTLELDAVYCSDLQRSYQTAEIAFAEQPTSIFRDPRLRECDYGALTRRLASRVAEEKRRHVRTPFHGVESYADCARRVRHVLKDIAQLHPGGTVLIVAHRATQYGLEHWLRGVDLEQAVTAPWGWQPGWRYAMTPEQI